MMTTKAVAKREAAKKKTTKTKTTKTGRYNHQKSYENSKPASTPHSS